MTRIRNFYSRCYGGIPIFEQFNENNLGGLIECMHPFHPELTPEPYSDEKLIHYIETLSSCEHDLLVLRYDYQTDGTLSHISVAVPTEPRKVYPFGFSINQVHSHLMNDEAFALYRKEANRIKSMLKRRFQDRFIVKSMFYHYKY